MYKENASNISIVPERRMALKKTWVNAFFYGAGAVFVLLVFLVLAFPGFFGMLASRQYQKLFIPQTFAYYFFLKTAFALAAIWLLSAASYYLLVFFALSQKEIAVILSAEGIASRYGKLTRFVSWKAYSDVAATTNPFLIRLKTEKHLLVFDVFDIAKLKKRIADYRRSLEGADSQGMAEEKTVAAAIIRKGGKFLIAKRKQGGAVGGKWEFPGGKLEDGETPEQGLVRELKEELDIDAQVGSFFAESLSAYPSGTFRIMAYQVEDFKGEIVLREHDECRWVSLEELESFDFLSGDKPIIRKLLQIGG